MRKIPNFPDGAKHKRKVRPGGITMKIPWFLIALTIVNLGLLIYTLGQTRPAAVAPVLRGRALEIVDDQGRVRASIKVQPATMANGKPYPENVILRLIDPNGR